MDPHRWQRIKEIYAEALKRPAADRAAFVAAAGDAGLGSEVLDLLTAGDRAGDGFLDDTAAGEVFELLSASCGPASTQATWVGRIIGPYRVVRELGQGGMGAVYLAEREGAGFEQRVAIKVIRAAAIPGQLARFQHERQILAGLDHPHIARLFDGGTTEEGLPWFAMEPVEGEPVTRFCNRQRLTVDERIALFLQVCEAVRYAHQNLVVHRDLKPSNLLVTRDGSPKLLDFGIAKLLGEGGGERTRTALSVLTPDYASPEQIHGRPVTTASDVYSLGVLLYELLAGRRPHRAETGSLPELVRSIETGPPPRPSVAVTTDPGQAGEIAALRGTTPPTLRRRLTGDLDAIVLKALRPEPERRYPSAEALAEDLRREQRGLPVEARQGTFAYRTGKFFRRYRTVVAAVLLVVLSLAAGLAAATRQARIAERQRQQAEHRFQELRRLASSVLFEYHDAVATLPGSTAVRELMVGGALEYLDSLAAQAGSDPELQDELATAYQRVGDLQGRPNTANLGNLDAAQASYSKALAIRRRLLAASPESADARAALATLLQHSGEVLWWRGDTPGALEHLEESRTLSEGLVRQDPDEPRFQLALAESLQALGDVALWNSETEAALAGYERALEILKQRVEAQPAESDLQRRLGVALQKVGEAWGWAGDSEAAVTRIGEAVAILEPLAAASPGDTALQQTLAVTHMKLGENHQALGDLSAATRAYDRALELSEALAAADPADARAARHTALLHAKLGEALADAERPQEALAHLEEGLALQRRLAAADPTNAEHRRDEANSLYRIGAAVLVAGRPSEALERQRQALALRRELAGADPGNVMLQRDLMLSHTALGDTFAALARAEEPGNAAAASWRRAVEHYREAHGLLQELAAQGKLQGADRGEPERLAGKIEEAERGYR